MTGDEDVDVLLDDLAPVLGRALADLSPAQRRVARLILVDGLRRSEVAERLGVSRATVSVTAERGGYPPSSGWHGRSGPWWAGAGRPGQAS